MIPSFIPRARSISPSPASGAALGQGRRRGRRCRGFHPAAGLLFLLASTQALAQVIGPEVPVSADAARLQNEPDVAVVGDTAVAIWMNAITNGGGIGWGFSLDGGLTWTDGGQLPYTPESGGGAFFATVCADNAGNFYTAVLSGNGFGISISFWAGAFQGTTFVWQPGKMLVPLASYDGYDRPWLASDPDRGFLYLTYTLVHPARVGVYPNGHEMTIYFMRSLDRGATWSVPQALSGPTCNGVRPAVGPDGELYVVWEDFAAQQVVGRKSVDFGATFSPPFGVAPMLDNLATPPVGWKASAYGRDNPIYPPLDGMSAADFPAIAVDRSNGVHRGSVYVAWSDYAAGAVDPAAATTYEREPNDSYVNATPFTIGDDVQGFSRSGDFGPQDCDNFTFLGTAGTTLEISGELWYVSPGSPNEPTVGRYLLLCGADTTRLVQVANVGIPQSYSGSLPPLIYTFPRTERYYILAPCGGADNLGYLLHTRALHVAPGQGARDFRDIVLVSSSDGGASWSTKRRVNDDPPGFDDAMPSLAVDGLDGVHVAWYDRRDDPSCSALVHTYWTESLDGGVTFLPNRRLSSQAGSWVFDASNLSNIGDHLAVRASGERAWVLWTDARGVAAGSRPHIYGATVRAEPPTAVAVAGFRAEAEGARLALLWTVGDASGITGFRLHRSVGDDSYQPLEPGWLSAHGEGAYRTEDPTALPGEHYRYRLEVAHSDATSTWLGPIEGELPGRITRLAWEPPFPNPFESSVRLTLALPHGGSSAVQVFDLLGHEVATLWRGALPAGRRTLAWDGRDRGGRRVAAGVYLLRAQLDGERVTTRVVRIR